MKLYKSPKLSNAYDQNNVGDSVTFTTDFVYRRPLCIFPRKYDKVFTFSPPGFFWEKFINISYLFMHFAAIWCAQFWRVNKHLFSSRAHTVEWAFACAATLGLGKENIQQKYVAQYDGPLMTANANIIYSKRKAIIHRPNEWIQSGKNWYNAAIGHICPIRNGSGSVVHLSKLYTSASTGLFPALARTRTQMA